MSLPKIFKSSKGFTLIELIVVIGMLTILFAIVLVAVNPGRQFMASRNTARRNDVNAILNAVHQYAADNNGSLPAVIDATTRTIQSGTGAGLADLCATLTTNSKYLSALPEDPSTLNGVPITNCGAAYNSGYTITKTAAGLVTVAAPSAEDGTTISVSR